MMWKRLLPLAILVTSVAGTAFAQNNKIGYIYAGGGAGRNCDRCGTELHVGAGVERVMRFGLGVGAEGGYLRNERQGSGLVSVNASYHFNRDARLTPFISGGPSLLFRKVALSFEGSSYQGGANFGGGFDYWGNKR